ncbi:MAG: response regulator [Ethanoligenens sp.]
MYKVMLVDDDRAMLYMLRRYKGWKKQGFSIVGQAEDGREALRLLKNDTVDLLLSDIKMPGMDGIELVQEVAKQKLGCTVVFLSTVGDFPHAQEAIRLGAFDYLLKPLDETAMDELLARVQAHLEERTQAESRKIQAADILTLYVPQEEVRELSAALLENRNEDAARAVERAFHEAYSAFGGLDVKTSGLLELVLSQTAARVLSASSFVATVEDVHFADLFRVGMGEEEAKALFLDQIVRLSDLVRKYELGCSESTVRKICAYVLDHAEQTLTLQMVAEVVHLRPDYVGKLFYRKTGRHFSAFVTAVKLEQAKYLLRSDDYKNYELSEKLGYADTDYFCRIFKEYTGLTPVQYRNMHVNV